MKKIFFMAHSMDVGGAEISLLGLLENMDYKQYSVDLFLLRHEGPLLNCIPREVNLLPENKSYSSLGVPIKDVVKSCEFKIAVGRVYGKIKAHRRNKKLGYGEDSNVINEYSHKYTVRRLPLISDIEYDVAISFVSPHYIVAEKVRAHKKVAWIHTDYSVLKVDKMSELLMWDKYDKIVSISPDVTKSFLKTFPSLAKKIYVIENIIPLNYINRLAYQFSVRAEMPAYDGVNALSIGRFVPPKRFKDIPEMCRLIRNKGISIKWYLIGYGLEEEEIKEKIKEYGIEDSVIILGKKENPYPYIQQCDVYIQPSYYEGKSIAVREAQLFHKPVIITNYSTAHAQIEDGFDGFIVPMEINLCASEIAELLQDKRNLERIAQNTRKKDYINISEIARFYELMEET